MRIVFSRKGFDSQYGGVPSPEAQEHRYHDHWIDEHTFDWQSQNATTPASKRSQEIVEHLAKGIAIRQRARNQARRR